MIQPTNNLKTKDAFCRRITRRNTRNKTQIINFKDISDEISRELRNLPPNSNFVIENAIAPVNSSLGKDFDAETKLVKAEVKDTGNLVIEPLCVRSGYEVNAGLDVTVKKGGVPKFHLESKAEHADEVFLSNKRMFEFKELLEAFESIEKRALVPKNSKFDNRVKRHKSEIFTHNDYASLSADMGYIESTVELMPKLSENPFIKADSLSLGKKREKKVKFGQFTN